MNRFAVFFAVTLCLLLPSASSAQLGPVVVRDDVNPEPWTQAPADFRGIRFGDPEAAAIAQVGPLKCQDVKAGYTPAHRRCRTTDKKNAFRVNNMVVMTYYLFHDGRFVGVEMDDNNLGTLNQTPLFPLMERAFRERYGLPSTLKTFRYVGTKDDGTVYEYDVHVIRWENDDATIAMISEAGDHIASITIDTSDWARLKKEQAERVSKPAVTKF
jgi:hypothetical protein